MNAEKNISSMFWIILGVSALIIMIDIGIKNQILAEAQKLREVIDGEKAGRQDKGNSAGAYQHTGNSTPVLFDFDPGVETRDVLDRNQEASDS